MTKPYDIDEHRHRFSVWAAARAAQRGFRRATVGTLREALEACGVVEFLGSVDAEAIDDAEQFADLHRRWCRSIVASLQEKGVANPTFGLAAQLIGVYLKSVVVLGARSATALASLAHPPVDGILLSNISSSSQITSGHKKAWAKVKWTQLDEERYYQLITQFRDCLAVREPFWMLERFWTVTDE